MSFTTPSMSLRVWNLLSDPYDHDQLATNWAKVDLHDHSYGRGVQIPTDGILDGAVTAAKLAPGAASIQNNSVTAQKFAPLPACRVYNNVALSIPNATGVALTFNSERYDSDGMHDTVTNNNRITCKTAGVYVITTNVEFVANGTGNRQLYIRLNGSTVIGYVTDVPSGSVAHIANLTVPYALVVNDYLEVLVAQTSGAALNVSASGNYSPEFAATWITP